MTPLTDSPQCRNRPARLAAALALAFGMMAALPPDPAGAGTPVRQIAERIDKIAWQAERLPEIRGARHRAATIDRLQAKLHKLERANERKRGHLARVNEMRIDRLQGRLARMERRASTGRDRWSGRHMPGGNSGSSARDGHRGGDGWRQGY